MFYINFFENARDKMLKEQREYKSIPFLSILERNYVNLLEN